LTTPSTFALSQLDAVAFLRTLPAESVDLLVTDPAYESLEKHRAVGTTTRLKVSAGSSNPWFRVFPNARFAELFEEAHRVLKRDTHFYLMCDPETAFIAKPIAEQAGFKFWKPLVWDKCLGPETPVRTDRGVVPIKTIEPGERVYTPNGRLVAVLATRTTRAPAVRIALSTGTVVVASNEHRFLLRDGTQAEAASLCAGMEIAEGGEAWLAPEIDAISLHELLEDDERVLEAPDSSGCLFCGRAFETPRAAAAHQARFCESARSKAPMAEELGVAPKRLRRWLNEGRLPAAWAKQLGLDHSSTGQTQLRLQNDAAKWFEPSLRLDYGWGKLIGLFAAHGWKSELAVRFALHQHEQHLHNHIDRLARALGLDATTIEGPGNGVCVEVCSKLFARIISHFVGGTDAETKCLLAPVYEAPREFRRGVFDGILEGDGHWSRAERRETIDLASLDLSSFMLRFARSLGHDATIRRHENHTAGFWRVRFDPAEKARPITVVSVESMGETDLVDIAIDDARQLYQLHDGAITHNCSIGMGYHYRARYEFVMFFEKGKRKLHDLGIADVLEVPRVRGGYPAEKPSALSQILIGQSSVEGDLVVDPFMGSGSSGVAALELKRRYAGNDVSDDALKLARERLLAKGGVEGPVAVGHAQAGPVQQRLALG